MPLHGKIEGAGPRRPAFDLSLVPEQDRLPYWIEQVWAASARAECLIQDPRRLYGRLQHLQVRDLSLNILQCSSQAFRRDARHIRSDPEELSALVWVRRGWTEVHYGPEQQRLGPGGFFLNSGLDPGQLTVSDDCEIMLVVIPLAPTQHQVGWGHRTSFQAFSAGSVASELLAAHLAALWREDVENEAETRLLEQSFLHTLSCASVAQEPDGHEANRLARLHQRQILAFIEENLHQPGLTAAQIAAGVGLSRSHLYRLFPPALGGVMAHLWQRRLARAQSMLQQRQSLSRGAVEQVASLCGFESAAHFSRRFKGYTGLSPRRWASSIFRD